MADTTSLSDIASIKSNEEANTQLGDGRGGVGETKRQLKPRHLQVSTHVRRFAWCTDS